MKFKKIMSVMAGFVLVGATLGMAHAFPTPYVQDGINDYAVVYGANAAQSDFIASQSINDYLNSLVNSSQIEDSLTNESVITEDFSDSLGVTEDEIVFGSTLIGITQFSDTLTDSKIPTLIDGKIEWDDGNNAKTSFNVHEEILLNNMKIQTTLDENDIEGVSLTNDEDLEYRYVFEETLDTSRIGCEDADTLTINILGKEYEVNSLDSDSIEVSVSNREIFVAGQSKTIGDRTITVSEIFDNAVQIGDELIDEGQTKTVNGLEVKVETIAYHSASGSQSKAILRVGEDLLTTFEDGEDYIGEDANNVEWVWSINNPGEAEGYIGVKYDKRQLDQDDDLVYVGGSYNFPENYASVQFEEITNVNYGDFKLSFEDDSDFGDINDSVILEGPEDDSFLIGSEESNTLAVHYNGTYNLYYLDEDNDFIYSGLSNDTISATLIYDDTSLEISLDENGDLILENVNEEIVFDLTGTSSIEDISINGESKGNENYDVMTHTGIIFEDPESNLDDDAVVFGVPNEQVYAKVSVVGQGQEIIVEPEVINDTNVTLPQLGGMIVLDSEVDSVKDKNLIVVGGSCINSVAATLLGVPMPTCGEAFTEITGVGDGQAWIQSYTSPYNDGKVALLVAGYNAEDTTSAVNSLIQPETIL